MKNTKRFLCILMAALILAGAPLSSYMEARAVEVLAGIALGDLLFDLLIGAGVTYLGYETINHVRKNSDADKSLRKAVVSDPAVSRAVEDARSLEGTDGTSALKEGYSHTSSSGFRVINGGSSGGNSGISIGINSFLLAAAARAVKKWADSGENSYEGAASSELDGTKEVDSEYMKSIKTAVKALPSVGSMSDIDAFFGIDGAAEYLASQGYPAGSYYFVACASGTSTSFVPVPSGCALSAYRLAWLGSSGVKILSSGDYHKAVVQCGVRDASSFFSYFNSLPARDSKIYAYSHASGKWSASSSDLSPLLYNFLSGGSYSGSFYTCGYEEAYAAGSLISYTYFANSMARVFYTFKAPSKYVTYDSSKAPSIPGSGYVDFKIPESDYSGFKYDDLSLLLEQVSSISDMIDKTIENQDKVIEQNKGILEALNSIHPLIQSIADGVGEAVSMLGLIKLAIDDLPDKLADPLADAVASINIPAPEVVIPPINIPEIVIPPVDIPEMPAPNVNVSVQPPAITLNPEYSINVRNDFTGLEGIISRAVEASLAKLFVPDQAAAAAKVDDIKEYFEFKNEVERKVVLIGHELLGIKPSPVLKIPIGKVSSKKYKYGMGDFIIIDCSWYYPYKDFGDKVILCLFLLSFFWHVFINLPGIISGTATSVSGVYSSWYRYLDTKGNLRIEGKKG